MIVVLIFLKNFLKIKLIRLTAKNIFSCQNIKYLTKGIKYLTRLRLGLSGLDEHKFKNNCQDTY